MACCLFCICPHSLSTFPFAKQRRLRHLRSIAARNIVNKNGSPLLDTYFTLHLCIGDRISRGLCSQTSHTHVRPSSSQELTVFNNSFTFVMQFILLCAWFSKERFPSTTWTNLAQPWHWVAKKGCHDICFVVFILWWLSTSINFSKHHRSEISGKSILK